MSLAQKTDPSAVVMSKYTMRCSASYSLVTSANAFLDCNAFLLTFMPGQSRDLHIVFFHCGFFLSVIFMHPILTDRSYLLLQFSGDCRIIVMQNYIKEFST